MLWMLTRFPSMSAWGRTAWSGDQSRSFDGCRKRNTAILPNRRGLCPISLEEENRKAIDATWGPFYRGSPVAKKQLFRPCMFAPHNHLDHLPRGGLVHDVSSYAEPPS